MRLLREYEESKEQKDDEVVKEEFADEGADNEDIQCESLTKSGSQCKNEAAEGSEYCKVHFESGD